MVKEPKPRRLLLRAEVVMPTAHFVAHTLSISQRGVFIETESAPRVGTELRLRLSFPRLVAPIELGARVMSTMRSGGPGDPSGIEVEFDQEDRPRVLHLMSSLDAVPSYRPPEKRYRVLLVEDNDLIQQMFAYGVDRYFRGKATSVTVDIACDGGQAWSMLRGRGYDLAIVDHYLPVLDGSSLLALVRREEDLSTLPLVGISVGGTEVRESMLKAGADLFLSKPIVLRDLFLTLERLATQPTVGL
jgi:CheY-like chemotaxis protein